MSRSGFTLIELSMTILALATIVQIGGTIIASMAKLTPEPKAPPQQLIDMAADRLRADARDGAAVDRGQLLAGRHRWSLSHGLLLRDGALRCHVQRASWSERDGRIAVDIATAQEPAFRIELPRAGSAAMTRAGFVCSGTAFVICAAALGCLAVAESVGGGRARDLASRQERIQAREWCLGAGALAPGSEVVVGRWRVERHRDGSIRASGPAGALEIDARGNERWRAGERGGR